jgi:pimeloyl-ACP methyl ester carboxylesterase
MPYVWTNGFRTWYEESGSGFPVVLAHVHTFDRTMWVHQVPALDQHYRVIAYDLRGHGRSEVPFTGYWARQFADDLRALLDGLDIPRAALIGNSVSASSIEFFAVDHPQRVAAAVLADGSFGQEMDHPEDIAMFDRMWDVTEARGIRAAMEEVWLPGSLFVGARMRPEVMAAVREICLNHPGQGWRDPNRRSQPRPTFEEMSQQYAATGILTLFIYGELDYHQIRSTAELVRRHLPSVEVVSIPNAGHTANMEEPAAFNAALLDFLKRSL